MNTYKAQLSPNDFEQLVENVKMLNEKDLSDLIKSSCETIRLDMTRAFPDINMGVKYTSYIVVLGACTACIGLTDIDPKKKRLIIELSKDDMDEKTALAVVTTYEPSYPNIVAKVAHMFPQDLAIRTIMNYLVGLACYGVENKKGLVLIERIFRAWFTGEKVDGNID